MTYLKPQGSFSRRWLRASVVALLMLLALVSIVSAQEINNQDAGPVSSPDAGWPGCGFGCTANDVTLTQLYLADANGNPLPTCTPGETVTGYVWGDFYNNSGTNRYAVVLLGDVYINGQYASTLQTGSTPGVCGGDTIPAGSSSNELTSITWTCGQAVDLRNVTVSWDTSATTCNAFFAAPSCGNRKTKCAASVGVVPVRPLVQANFSATNACVGDPVQFANTSSGGVSPISYSWAFGDGGTSTLANPTHTYSSSGTYNVQLNMSDASTPPVTDSDTQSVTVYDNPTSSFTSHVVSETNNTITIGFTNNSVLPSNGCTPTYLWNFGDGTTSTEANPQHTFARRSANYPVTLTVTTCGCSSTFTSNVSVPLSIDLGSFTATQQGVIVMVNWETISEVNNMGFNLYRATSLGGTRQTLGFFPAAYPGSPMGASYSYQDNDVVIGQTYYYWLQDLDDTGASTYHGPVSITVQSPTAVTLNQMQAGANPSNAMGMIVLSVLAICLVLILGTRLPLRSQR